MPSIICKYCKGPAEMVDSSVVYGRSYGPIYLCSPCDAYVGCHKGTTKPLGEVADATTRSYRKLAHATFDPYWKEGLCPRKLAYKELAQKLGVKRIHIGESDAETCKRIIEAAKEIIQEAIAAEGPNEGA